jgi:hypothetical protein
MKLFQMSKDGGPESKVWGFFLIEWKRFFSVALMHFADGSREAYHSHAFNSISWVLSGTLSEQPLHASQPNIYKPSRTPIRTARSMFHRVTSIGDTYVLTFRGPWAKTWHEYIPAEDKYLELTSGRKVIWSSK